MVIKNFASGALRVEHSNLSFFVDEEGSLFNLSLYYPCSNFSDCSEISISFSPGIYFLEVWGAQGGKTSIEGGLGGYSCGIFRTSEQKNLYLHIGGSIEANDFGLSGYNGGGNGANNHDGPGGGATDFRNSSGLWSSNLDSRIIVAGGGGGPYINKPGGDGGGLVGTSFSYGGYTACYGAQNSCEGGIATHELGIKGIGAGNYYGGGGGGYYGGGNAQYCGGGGGSGFIGGVESLNVIAAKTLTGVNSGQGRACITVISSTSSISCHKKGCTIGYIMEIILF